MISNGALSKWLQDNNIKSRTIEYFWDAFNNYKNDLSKEEFELYFDNDYKKDIKLWFKSISQTIVFEDYLDENVDVIEASIEIGYKDDKYYGTYSVYYDLLGNVTDDALLCEWEKWYINLRKKVLEELKAEFFNTAVNESIEPDLANEIINKTSENLNKLWYSSEEI